MKPYQNYDWLYNEYVINDREMADIAKECNVSPSSISQWVKKLGVKHPYKDQDWLYQEYVVNNRTQESIAKDFNVDRKTIDYYLDKFDISKSRSSYAYPDVELVCSLCGEHFTKPHNYVRGRLGNGFEKFYCSDECIFTAQSTFMQGENNPNYEGTWHGQNPGEIFTAQELRDRALKNIAEAKENGTWNDRMKALHAGHKRYFSTEDGKKKRREIAIKSVISQASGKETSIEKKIREHLETLNIDFRPQEPIGWYAVDFFIPENNVVIEVNGDYWHGNPAVFSKLNEMQQKNVKRDKQKRDYLSHNGYTLLEIWETDIKHNFDNVIKNIHNVITR